MSKESIHNCPYCGRVAGAPRRLLPEEAYWPCPGTYSLCPQCGEIGQFYRKRYVMAVMRCQIDWGRMPPEVVEKIRRAQGIIREKPGCAPCIQCPDCARVSYNSEDVAAGRCAACLVLHSHKTEQK